jgi:hypothetical protein
MVTARLTAPRWALFAQVSTSAAGLVIRANRDAARVAALDDPRVPGTASQPATAGLSESTESRCAD